MHNNGLTYFGKFSQYTHGLDEKIRNIPDPTLKVREAAKKLFF